MKVFISFATEDESRAESLFEELHGAGADVFKWGRSEVAGTPTWSQLLGWIGQSDVFIALISQHALQSLPVADEIEQAAYSYSNKRKPEKIIPAILERDVVPPIVIERFPRLDFVDFRSGLGRLLSQLGLQRPAKPKRDTSSMHLAVQDLDRLFRDFKRKHPGPSPANIWASGTAATLPRRTRSVAQILRDHEPSGRGRSRLPDYLTTVSLDAPSLSGTASLLGFVLRWAMSPRATAFVLERSRSNTFADPEVIFEGTDTQFEDAWYSWEKYFYRVKAVSPTEVSAWSNVVASP